jgi:hypothetical protein
LNSLGPRLTRARLLFKFCWTIILTRARLLVRVLLGT